MILPDRMFFAAWIHDRRLRKLNPQLQLLLIFLRPLCDRNGRFEFNPALIHMALYRTAECGNVSVRDVEAWLESLRRGGYIKSYTGADGRRIGEVAKDYWRQKLTYGREVFEAENAQTELGLPAVDPPPKAARPRSDMKRRERAAAPAGAAAEDILFSALAEAEGCDISQMTAGHRRKVQHALEEILRAAPRVTPEDIETRAREYRRQMPGAQLTAHGLAQNWARLSATPRGKKAAAIMEAPVGWRSWINENCEGTDYAHGGEKEGLEWHELPDHVRAFVAEKMTKKGKAA